MWRESKHPTPTRPLRWPAVRLMPSSLQRTTFADAVKAGLVTIDGDPRKLDELMSMLDTFKVMFEVVEPKPSGQ